MMYGKSIPPPKLKLLLFIQKITPPDRTQHRYAQCQLDHG